MLVKGVPGRSMNPPISRNHIYTVLPKCSGLSVINGPSWNLQWSVETVLFFLHNSNHSMLLIFFHRVSLVEANSTNLMTSSLLLQTSSQPAVLAMRLWTSTSMTSMASRQPIPLWCTGIRLKTRYFNLVRESVLLHNLSYLISPSVQRRRHQLRVILERIG